MSALRQFPTIGSHTDVVLTSLTADDVLTWDGTKWINQAPSGGGSFDPHSPGPIGDVGPDTGGFTTVQTNNGVSGILIDGENIKALGFAGAYYPFVRFAMTWNALLPDSFCNALGNGFAGRWPTAFINVIEFDQSVSLGTPATGCTRIGNIGGEMNVVDSSGNVTVISPHAKDAPKDLYEIGPGADEMERKANIYLCVVRWWAVTRRKLIDALDLAGRLGTPEQSAASWAEVLARRASGRMTCAAVETFAEYETRTGESLCLGDTPEARAAWLAMTPSQRWDSTQAAEVARSEEASAQWLERKAASAAAKRPFTEPEPTIYAAQTAPAFLL